MNYLRRKVPRMKHFAAFLLVLITSGAYSQDTPRTIEPGHQTSYDNKDLLLISLAGLALLLAIYFLFRRSWGTKN